MKIEIELISMYKNTKIDVIDDVFFVNGTKKDVDIERFMRRLFCITATWKENMVDNGILDGESYKVKIYDSDKKATYFGKNNFPANYGEFVRLISEVI